MNTMPPVTKNLIIINILFFLATYVARGYGIDLNEYLALHFFKADNFNPAQLVTYMFMHGGFSHILFNMFALFMFGRVLEQVWGGKRFLLFYLVCGVGAGLIQELVQYIEFESLFAGYPKTHVRIPDGSTLLVGEYLNYWRTVGASGSVFGILLGFGMLFPNERIFIMFLPIPIKAKYFVIGYAVVELLMGLANNPGDNVAHFAHLGGMIFGFFLIVYWKKKGVMYWQGRGRNDNETTYFR
ncbi:rhomboid family intramembrane serine protease [Bacteroides sp. 224]|uniref:rhomboid family intramembrane serine protease n=1 Tax=Bacteroides sp. 224 TaxID=2302936 RepID=UPI0013D610E2|nr:rhomboid family intramembrane serine protease [Bacteroides sp. 224]